VVAAEVVALVLVLGVVVPVGGQVAVGADGAEPEHGLGAGQAPADVPVAIRRRADRLPSWTSISASRGPEDAVRC